MIILKRNACCMPAVFFAPLYCDIKIPPETHSEAMNIKKTKLICPAMFTPDILTSPKPATIKLSIRETMF